MKYSLAPDCHNCDLRGGCKQVVWGFGPEQLTDIDWMLVAEAPGKQENKQGIPLVGNTGDETDWLFARNGIRFSNFYRTNVVKCQPANNRDPKPYQIAACAPWLEMELEMVRPRLIVAMGKFAAQWFLTVRNMELDHGIPVVDEVGRIIIPTYHVAAALHRPATMLSVQEDFRVIRDVIAGNREPRHIQDPYEGKEKYFELSDNDLP